MGEAIGDIIQGRGVKLQCRPYGRRLIEKFRPGRLHPGAQLGVQWVIAGQGEDVGALRIGDSLDDGTLAGYIFSQMGDMKWTASRAADRKKDGR